MKRTPLRKVSKKRQALLVTYRRLKKDYITENNVCECCADSLACDIHHKLPVGRGGKLCDTTIFMAVCRQCHDWIHTNPKEAKEKGYLL